MSKNYLLTIVDGFHYRYLVQTGILDSLLDHSDKLVVCGSNQVLSNLHSYTDPRLVFIELPANVDNSLRALHRFLRGCENRNLSQTLNIKSEQYRQFKPWKYYLRKVLGLLIEYSKINFSRLFDFVWFDKEIKKILEIHNIQVLILSTPGQKLDDIPFIQTAKYLGIKTISPVYSWDNLTAKGPLIVPPDQLVVWNDTMKNEAVEYHGYSVENIFVTGVPVFDPYFKYLSEATENSQLNFFNKLKIDHNKKVITLTTIPRVYFGNCHREIIKRIKVWIELGLLKDCILLVRPHPLDNTDYLDLQDGNTIIDNFGGNSTSNPKEWIPSIDNMQHLAATMAYSSVVINIASTITIDAACFNTPIINIAYDEKNNSDDYYGSVLRYYRYTHYQQVVETGAARLVYSPNELLISIQNYLSDKTIDQSNRKLLIKKQVGELNGMSFKKTVDALVGATMVN